MAQNIPKRSFILHTSQETPKFTQIGNYAMKIYHLATLNKICCKMAIVVASVIRTWVQIPRSWIKGTETNVIILKIFSPKKIEKRQFLSPTIGENSRKL
jgi:hypothetical protein